jgi:hypothetical protein
MSQRYLRGAEQRKVVRLLGSRLTVSLKADPEFVGRYLRIFVPFTAAGGPVGRRTPGNEN